MRILGVLALAVGLLLAGSHAGSHAGVNCGRERLDIDPVFSPDDGLVAFVSGGQGGCGDKGALMVASAEGGPPHPLLPGEIFAGRPQFSPDGHWLAFNACRGSNAFCEPTTVDVVRVDGTGERTLAPGGYPTWSPDGTELAFDTPDFGVAVIGVDGTGFRRLADGMFPSWSPTGDLIAYQATRFGSGGGLFTIRPDGTDSRRLTEHGAQLPIWSPDGRHIAFYDGGVNEAIGAAVIGADGTGYRAVGVKVANVFPLAWSPDGARLMLRGGLVWPISESLLRRPYPQENVVGISHDWGRIALGVASGTFAYEGSDLYVAGAAGHSPRLVSPPRCPATVSSGIHCFEGSDAADVIHGTGLVFGHSGDDVLFGSAGFDHIEGAFGNDVLYGGPRSDFLYGQAGNDRLFGGAGDDRLVGGPGADLLVSGTGRGRVYGDEGPDRIDARAGEGTIVFCGTGRDVVLANPTVDVARDCERVIRVRHA